MANLPNGYWAKTAIDREKRVVAWLPLADHLLDVGMSFEVLLDSGYARPLAETLGQRSLSRSQREFMCFLAFSHDVGKMNVGFQAKIFSESEDRTRATKGHVSEALAGILRNDADFSPHVFDHLGLSRLFEWVQPTDAGSDKDVLFLLASVLGHHGWPATFSPRAGHHSQFVSNLVVPQWSNWRYANPEAECVRLGSLAKEAWPAAFGTPDPIKLTSDFLDAFNGLLTLADWVGSDQQRFPVVDRGYDRVGMSRSLAQKAVRQNGIHIDGLQACAASLPTADAFGFDPNPMQFAVWESAEELEGGGLWILEAETGGGKTEAALGLFHRLLALGLVDGLYLALPTRTSASQIHQRAKEFSAAAFGAIVHPILAVPGYFRDEDAPPLQPSSVSDDPEASSFLEHWAAERPKRYLAAPIAVGMIDQVLSGVIDIKHAAMRWAAAGRSLLVIDEVHSSDEYGEALLCEMVRRHVRRGGYVLTMSATLGAASRARLLAQAKGMSKAKVPSLADAVSEAYPLLTASPRNGVVQRLPIAPPVVQKSVEVSVLPVIGDVEGLAQEIANHVRAGARVLCVRNTVNGAVSLQRALEELLEQDHFVHLGGVPILHHGRFPPDDRFALDRCVEREFGKNSARRPNGLVLVGTQTLEQSLDIDADILITDLCPMDVLLQRIGRLHRHARRDRPVGYEAARCIVVAPDEPLLSFARRGRHGIGFGAYPDVRIVDATLRVLIASATITLPKDNRRLVESAVHPEVLDAYAGEWLSHSMEADGRASASAVTARGALRQYPNVETNSFPQRRALDEKVTTRLGSGSLQVDLASPVVGPFKVLCRQVSFSSWQIAGLDLVKDAKAEWSRLDGGVTVSVSGRKFVYDRLGIRPQVDS